VNYRIAVVQEYIFLDHFEKSYREILSSKTMVLFGTNIGKQAMGGQYLRIFLESAPEFVPPGHLAWLMRPKDDITRPLLNLGECAVNASAWQ